MPAATWQATRLTIRASLSDKRRMNFIDYLILAVLLVSLLLGFFRGFLREAIGLLSWLGGLWLAWHYAYLLEPHLGGLIAKQPYSTWAARAILLLSVLVVGWIIGGIVSYFVHQSGISLMLDRMIGMLFGFIRGVVLVSIAIMLGEQLELQRTDWWLRSRLMPTASEVAVFIKQFAESAVAEVNQKRSGKPAAEA